MSERWPQLGGGLRPHQMSWMLDNLCYKRSVMLSVEAFTIPAQDFSPITHGTPAHDFTPCTPSQPIEPDVNNEHTVMEMDTPHTRSDLKQIDIDHIQHYITHNALHDLDTILPKSF